MLLKELFKVFITTDNKVKLTYIENGEVNEILNYPSSIEHYFPNLLEKEITGFYVSNNRLNIML